LVNTNTDSIREQKTTSDPTKIQLMLDYTDEIMDDGIFQNILTMIETKELIGIQEFKDIYSAEDMYYNITFVQSKIKYLEDLQRSLSLSNVTQRFTEIARLLDSLTVESYNPNIMRDMKIKISNLLDLLYLANNAIYNVYNIEDFKQIQQD
jgi:hypothetical protein